MIRSRLWLVLTLLVGQTIALAVGLLLYHQRLEDDLAQSIRAQVLGANGALARQLARLIESQHLGPIEQGTVGWHWLQANVELITLPNDGFVCILDREGRILCHPKLRENPAMAALSFGDAIVYDADGNRLGTVLEQTDAVAVGDSITGRAYFPSGPHLIGMARLGENGPRLLVHQHESGIHVAAAELHRRVLSVSIPLGLALLLSTGLGTWFIIKRYEHRLEAVNQGLESEVRRRTADLTATRNAVIFGLARLSESRDADTGQHLLRIQAYVRLLAKQLRRTRPDLKDEITDEWLEDLAFSSALHDIGKVGVPDAILLKPGRLTDDEFENIKRHCWIGGDCLYAIEKRLGESNFLTLAREIAYAHHERWDGQGYPFGLPGELIPLSARIVALADAYDAMTSKRPYKDPIPHVEVREHIRVGAGTQFDPDIVEAFLEVCERFNDLRAELQDVPENRSDVAEAA